MKVETASHCTDRIDLFSKAPAPTNLPKTDKDSLSVGQSKSTLEEWKDAVVDFFYKIWNYVKPYLCCEWMQPDAKAINLKKEIEGFKDKLLDHDPRSDIPQDPKAITTAFYKLSIGAQTLIKEYMRNHLKANNRDASDQSINTIIEQKPLDTFDPIFGNAVLVCLSDLRQKVGV